MWSVTSISRDTMRTGSAVRAAVSPAQSITHRIISAAAAAHDHGMRRCSVQTHGGLQPSPACCCSSRQLGPPALPTPQLPYKVCASDFCPFHEEGIFHSRLCSFPSFRMNHCWFKHIAKIYAVIDVGNSCGSRVSEQ